MDKNSQRLTEIQLKFHEQGVEFFCVLKQSPDGALKGQSKHKTEENNRNFEPLKVIQASSS